MPKQERIKTKYPGVYFIKQGTEKIFYIYYRSNGKQVEEKAGRQHADDMTPARAAGIRAARTQGKESSNSARREQANALKQEEADKMTIERLWTEYKTNKADSKAINTDEGRYEKYLQPSFGDKEPHEIIRLDVERLRMKLLKTLKPQTVKHVMGLLKRIVHYGAARQLCRNLNFEIEAVKVDNQKTEDLNPEQLKKLLEEIGKSTDIEAAAIMKLALFTGMRRGEMFKLKWSDIDFQRGFIAIKNPKGGVSQKIPLNEQARQVLENHPKTSEYVFVRPDGEPFTDIRRRVNPIKEAAGITGDFRALHGLRHTYASMLASSGKVDLYTLQKLLTHKSPIMTQRYAHLRDDALRNASTLAGQIIADATGTNVIELQKENEG
jgi:integrase